VQDAEGRPVGNGQLRRLRTTRNGEQIDAEQLVISFAEHRSKRFKLVIENGDDPPLDLAGAEVLVHERRIYFDPQGNKSLRLYFNDPQLPAPQYEYSRLHISWSSDISQASISEPFPNPAYIGRPDERPWSENHGWVMWAALVIAVVALGSVAFRGLKA
jgi:hypothetical protein